MVGGSPAGGEGILNVSEASRQEQDLNFRHSASEGRKC